MKIYVRSELDEKSQAQEDAYYAAVKILRAAGFDAEYIPCVHDDGENPGHIRLREGGR